MKNKDCSFIKNNNLLVEKLGYFPTFHDDEIIKTSLDRKDSSCKLEIYSFNSEKKLLVIFMLKNLKQVSLSDFNHQNVIFDLNFTKKDNDILMEINASFGLCGEILCEEVEILSVLDSENK